MKSRIAGSMCAAGLLSVCVGAFAQEPQPTTRTAPGGSITVTGCVQREADYRRAKDAGKGGVAGTGVGAGNEFILADTSMSPAASANAPIGTSGSAAAYELTGSNEGQVAAFVGKRVEIVGTLKPAETTAGSPTGGATAGAPPTGIDATSKDLQLRELEITSVREATGTCPAMK